MGYYPAAIIITNTDTHTGRFGKVHCLAAAEATFVAENLTENGSTTINGITSTTTGIDLNNKPQWKQSVSGANTQFHESYMGPGLNSFVEIDRTINIQSVTESTSTFTQ